MSNQMALWSLAVTVPKGRIPPSAWASKAFEMYMPSIALLPHWCIGIGDLPWSDDMASTSWSSWQKGCRSFERTSSFISTSNTMKSPASCHLTISCHKSVNSLSQGQLSTHLELQNLTCCWYINKMVPTICRAGTLTPRVGIDYVCP